MTDEYEEDITPILDASCSSKSKKRLLLRRRQAEKAASKLNADAASFTPNLRLRVLPNLSRKMRTRRLETGPQRKPEKAKKKNKKKPGPDTKQASEQQASLSCVICADEDVKFIAFGKCDHHICSLCAFRMRYKSREFFAPSANQRWRLDRVSRHLHQSTQAEENGGSRRIRGTRGALPVHADVEGLIGDLDDLVRGGH